MATSPSKLFVDSSAFIALVCDDEPVHSAAVEYYDSRAADAELVTTLLVVSETYTWLRSHVGYGIGVAFLQSIEEGVLKGNILVIHFGPEIWDRTRRILQKYHDHALSYVDAASFVALDDFGITDVFTFDRHFRVLKANVWPMVQR